MENGAPSGFYGRSKGGSLEGLGVDGIGRVKSYGAVAQI